MSAEHDELSELLPWFVTGQLSAEETARVEAHLAGCAECQAEVAFEKRLTSEVARLPIDVERGWAQMRGRLEANDDAPPARGGGRAAWLGWGMAATFAIVAGVSWLPQMQTQTRAQAPEYAALGAAAGADASGNVVVVFHPDTTERQLRAVLKAGEARIVDGPTAAGGYVLHVSEGRKAAALKVLRAQDRVVLAEPIETH